MADNFNGDFARLVPRNHVAQLLFSETYVYAEKNDTFHFRFMNRTEREPLPVSEEPVESSTDYDSYHESDGGSTQPRGIGNLGHFVFSFNLERSPELPRIGWRVGRGKSKSPSNRDVDMLLAKPGDNLSKTLASMHMLFQFNPLSRLFMLKGGSPKVPVEYSIGGIWRKLERGEQQLMYQSSTLLRAGLCEYELEYTIEEKHKEAYLKWRNIFVDEIAPSTASLLRPFCKMPGDSCVPRGRYLEFETHGFGAFGWINQGADTKTGNPIAIKELRISSPGSRHEVMAEVQVGRRFLDKRGLLPILDTMCEHGDVNGCCDMEKFFIFMPLALSDFTAEFWSDSGIARDTKLLWLRETLEGIKTLHAMGIMHRDIRPKNMLIISMNPPRAALCDYGKATNEEISTVTTLGPIPTLAPEVWTVPSNGPYTAKIDMWAYGYAIAEILGYSVHKYPSTDRTRSHITPSRFSAILRMLRDHCETSPEDEPLVDMVEKLLVWNPTIRWSATQALEHECWDPIVQEREQAVEGREESPRSSPSRNKRPQHRDIRSDPAD